jgi:preprotein translocase subunit SecF
MNYLKLAIVPLILLAISMSYLLWLVYTGNLGLDIDLKGGTQIIITSQTPIEASQVESALKQYEASVRTAKGLSDYSVFIEFDSKISPDDVLKTLADNDFKIGKDQYSVQSVEPVLGQSFFTQALIALLFSFIFMAITAFIIFKKPVLSLRIIFSAFADMVETVALSQILGIDLSLATFAAILLIIGYSADDDIMLTTKVTKGSGEVKDRIKRARKTAFTMFGTTIVALFSLFVITESVIIDQIASIMLLGLMFDLINTWTFNAPILRWYAEKKMMIK